MIDKSVSTLRDAIAGIHDGATIMIGGFGPAGQPTYLIDALIEQGARCLIPRGRFRRRLTSACMPDRFPRKRCWRGCYPSYKKQPGN